MKANDNRSRLRAIAILAVVGLSLSGAQDQKEHRASPVELQAITAAAPGTSVLRYIGRSVLAKNGRPVGRVWDVLAGADSGSISYVLVSSEPRNRLRLAPFGALERGDGTDAFRMSRGEDAWDDLPSFEVSEFSDGRITLSEAVRRMLSGHFGQVAAPEAEFFLLGMLRGRRVVTPTENVGTIRDLMIQPQQKTALAVVTPQDDFAIAGREFLVPLRGLNLSATQPKSITTPLRRADFERANQSAGQRPLSKPR